MHLFIKNLKFLKKIKFKRIPKFLKNWNFLKNLEFLKNQKFKKYPNFKFPRIKNGGENGKNQRKCIREKYFIWKIVEALSTRGNVSIF